MKRWITMIMLLLFGTALYAQGVDVTPESEYDAAIATFAGFAGAVVFVVEGFKKLIPSLHGIGLQIVSWITGVVLCMLMWVFDVGFVADVTWYIALLYGLGASLVSNGIADVGLVQWIIGLFCKKKA